MCIVGGFDPAQRHSQGRPVETASKVVQTSSEVRCDMNWERRMDRLG
jgi:hypothetical protein